MTIRVLIKKNYNPKNEKSLKLTLVAVLLGIVAFSFSNIVDYFFPDSLVKLFGPLASVPTIIILYFSYIHRQKIINEAEKVKERNIVLEKELELARKIHQKLLPEIEKSYDNLLVYSKYIPIDKVGGDFFDLFKSKNKISFFIGDVSGHEIPQGIFCTTCKNGT